MNTCASYMQKKEGKDEATKCNRNHVGYVEKMMMVIIILLCIYVIQLQNISRGKCTLSQDKFNDIPMVQRFDIAITKTNESYIVDTTTINMLCMHCAHFLVKPYMYRVNTIIMYKTTS